LRAAVRAQVLFRAVRTARAAPADSLPASRDHGFLMRTLTRLLGRTAQTRMSSRDAYDLWAETYPPWPHNPLMQAEQAVLTRLIAVARPRRALDVGTGTGRCRRLLSAAGARFVVGVDLSLAMLGQQHGEGRRLCADACHLPFADASFDVV